MPTRQVPEVVTVLKAAAVVATVVAGVGVAVLKGRRRQAEWGSLQVGEWQGRARPWPPPLLPAHQLHDQPHFRHLCCCGCCCERLAPGGAAAAAGPRGIRALAKGRPACGQYAVQWRNRHLSQCLLFGSQVSV